MQRILLLSVLLLSHQLSAEPVTHDPFADGEISCDEMLSYPDLVFSNGIDLGSGHGSPMAVDYNCNRSAADFPSLQALLALAEAVRQESGPEQCTGTIIYAHWRYYQFSLLNAGIAPRQLLQKQDHTTPASALEPYFKTWALASPSNYRLWQEFVEARQQAQPLLVKHYQQQFAMTEQEAQQVSTRVLALISQRAAGAFPGSSSISPNNAKPLPPLLQLLGSQPLDMHAIQTALANNPDDAEVDQALKLALMKQLPLPLVRDLITQLDQLDNGDESALFFALQNPDALQLLLASGATVDYANGFGKTALFYAIETGDSELVTTLLKQGANPNHRYKTAEELKPYDCTYNIKHSSRTPLMHAAQHSDPEMLKLLLASGADFSDIDGMNWSVLDYAVEHQREENAVYLRSVGATARAPDAP